jgi:hypothetical protein
LRRRDPTALLDSEMDPPDDALASITTILPVAQAKSSMSVRLAADANRYLDRAERRKINLLMSLWMRGLVLLSQKSRLIQKVAGEVRSESVTG